MYTNTPSNSIVVNLWSASKVNVSVNTIIHVLYTPPCMTVEQSGELDLHEAGCETQYHWRGGGGRGYYLPVL